ncbi:MAG TPA: type I glutamate--ammonia ligase [Chloroflexota bacterium]|nr:type I glutamate--ammonia ligase [Chloroflexota bacterium]
MTIDELDALKAARPASENALRWATDAGIKQVDVKFIDLVGGWQHFSIPLQKVTASSITEGFGFDGSSIRGFQKIHESDMVLLPDFDTAFVDPFAMTPTMSVVCSVHEPISLAPYTRDPRHVARRAEDYLRQSGVATTSYWGPEVEFYVFNSLSFDQTSHSGYYFIDSDEGIWNSGRNGTANLAYRPRTKEGYFPVPPMDKLQDLRSEMVQNLLEAGVDVEAHHHEVGTAGQSEIDIRFGTLTEMADRVMTYKYVVKNTAARHGCVATFMPKPIFEDNGSGMHVHQSLFDGDTNIFYDPEGYALLSSTARHYIGGLLAHAPAVLAFAAPTTNSYRRLVPGYEAPVNLAYSQRNRSACVRIPTYSDNPRARRIEFRPPDPSANPYLAFAAMLMAGLDGVERELEPPQPLEADLYELEGAAKQSIKSTPGSLGEVLDALEADHDFLTRGGVFTDDLIRGWIDYKRERELDPVSIRPHPYEFHLYHDI